MSADEDESVLNSVRDLLRLNENVMILMRGLPGSGKSTLARKLAGLSTDTPIHSADNFFIRNGVYRFDETQLSEAHTWNKGRALQSVKSQYPLIIIDNTNLQRFEMEPYAKIASEAGYRLLLVEPNTSWRRNARQCALKNSHGVPFIKLQEMLKHYDTSVTAASLMSQYGAAPVKSDSRVSSSSASTSVTTVRAKVAQPAITTSVTSSRSWSSVCAQPPTSSVWSKPTAASEYSDEPSVLDQRKVNNKKSAGLNAKGSHAAGRSELTTDEKIAALKACIGDVADKAIIEDVLEQVGGDIDEAQLALLELFRINEVDPPPANSVKESIPAPPGLLHLAHSSQATTAVTQSDFMLPSCASPAAASVSQATANERDERNNAMATGDAVSVTVPASDDGGVIPMFKLDLSRKLAELLFHQVGIDIDSDLALDDDDLQVTLDETLVCRLRDLVMQNALARLQRSPAPSTDTCSEDNDYCDSVSDSVDTCSLSKSGSISSLPRASSPPRTTSSKLPIRRVQHHFKLSSGPTGITVADPAAQQQQRSEDTENLSSTIIDTSECPSSFTDILEFDISHALLEDHDAVSAYCHAAISGTASKPQLREKLNKLLEKFQPGAHQGVLSLIALNLRALSGLKELDLPFGAEPVTALPFGQSLHLHRSQPHEFRSDRNRQAGPHSRSRAAAQAKEPRSQSPLPKVVDFDGDDCFYDESDAELTAFGGRQADESLGMLRQRVNDVRFKYASLAQQSAKASSGSQVQKNAAAYYVDESRKERNSLRLLERRFGQSFAISHRSSICEKGTLDLHGLTLLQAACALMYALRRLISGDWTCSRDKLSAITGVGRHSRSKVPVLRPRIAAILRRRGIQFNETDGVLAINVQQLVDARNAARIGF